jgi:hypothetical protein
MNSFGRSYAAKGNSMKDISKRRRGQNTPRVWKWRLIGAWGKLKNRSLLSILGGEAPAFVKSEGPLYLGGPTWRIELASSVWPRVSAVTEGHTD